ncbi:unnamed protein product [Cuscuta europaea]|uniref:Uncharacterized protein n=1 Tax=Cuscuta europaea TaxID=41803 RepID=A0A9P0Z091_CUSEU|nr:unnamed protein product [Cuscuta europaea]
MTSQQFIPQHILDPKNAKQAKLSESHIDAIKNGSGFPAHASIRFPAANERVDWHCDGWVNFFMYPFKIDRKTIPLSYGPNSEGRTARILSITTAEWTFGNLVADNEGMSPTLDHSRSVGLRRSRRNIQNVLNDVQGSCAVSVDDSDHESEGSRGGGENASAFVPLQMVFPVGQDSCPLPAKRSAQHAAVSSSSTRLMPSDYDLLNMVSRKKKVPSKLASGSSKTPYCPNIEMKIVPPLPVNAAANSDSGVKMNASFSRDFCCLKDAFMMRSEMPQVLLPSSSAAFSDISSTGLALASSAYAFQGES